MSRLKLLAEVEHHTKAIWILQLDSGLAHKQVSSESTCKELLWATRFARISALTTSDIFKVSNTEYPTKIRCLKIRAGIKYYPRQSITS